MHQYLKFRPPFQRWWNPKAKPLVALRTGRNSFPVKSAGGETKQSGGLFCRGEPSPGVPRRVPTRCESRCGLPHGESRLLLGKKTAVSSRHRLCCNFAGEGGTSPLQRQINQHLKFRPPFQRWWNPKAKPLVALRTGRNSFPVKSAGGETKQSGGLFCRGEPSPGVPRRVPTRGEFTQTVHTRRKFLCPVSSSM